MRKMLIVGGGIFGISAALELRRRGNAVTLFDPGPLPHPRAASTDISKVIRMDYGAEDFYWDMMAEAFPLWDRWNARWERPLYHETGILFLTSQPMPPGGFEHESFTRLQERGIAVERVDSAAIRQRFPAWNSDRYCDGYFNPRAGWAESGAVVSRLRAEAEAAGVVLRAGETFAGLLDSGSRVTGIFTARGERCPADAVILAAGAWTPGLLPELSGKLWPSGQSLCHFSPADLTPYRPPQFPVWVADLQTAGFYGFPAGGDGVIKVANHGPGWHVDSREQSQVPAGAEEAFRVFLRESIPGLAGATLARTRLCFYCDSFDGDFWIGRPPGRDGLLVCAGDSGHAFKFAPLLGPLIADACEDRPNRFLRRFAWREPDAGAGDSPRK